MQIGNVQYRYIRCIGSYINDFSPAGVFTSEDARAYKPRKELFELALNETGLHVDGVIHIGDSISSDVKEAGALEKLN